MVWLNDDQIDSLLVVCDLYGNFELIFIVCLCLFIGVCWNEIVKIKVLQIFFNKIIFINIKGKKNCIVFLLEDMY